jgi:hypothetical protein
MTYSFNAKNYDENKIYGEFQPIPPGDYRARIVKAEIVIAKTSNREMLKLELDVSGQTGKLFHNIVFMEDNPEMTDQAIGSFFDSFGINPFSEFSASNVYALKNKVGAVAVKQEEYQGKINPKVAYFIKKKLQDILPNWVEPKRKNKGHDGVPF